ncbi:MAG: histidine phosphatase family protein [Acidobacteriota bacterium]
MTTRVYLARHGTTVSMGDDRFAGETDVALAEAGRREARALGERPASERIAAFYASPLERALETARLIAEPHGLSVVPRPELREISHGRWEAKTRAEVRSLYPEEYARWEADPFSVAPEGGETGRVVTERALPALLDIVASHPGEQVLIVSHKATIRLLVSALLGLDPRRYRDRLDSSPGGLSILDFQDPARARLALFNDTSHCPA